jgi:hypothetical protein
MLDALVAVDLIEKQMGAHFDGGGQKNVPNRRGGAKRPRGTASPGKSTPLLGRLARRASLVVRSADGLRLG